jgi:hypothetical protein
MDLFASVSSVTSQWSMPQVGFGALADSQGTLSDRLYPLEQPSAQSALVKRDPFIDAVLAREAAGSASTIPSPGSSGEASGVLAAKSDWMSWAAESVKDRLDISAGFRLASLKLQGEGVATLLENVSAQAAAPTYFPTVASAYREALTEGTSGLLSNSVSGQTVSDIYQSLLKWRKSQPLFSVWG